MTTILLLIHDITRNDKVKMYISCLLIAMAEA